MPDVTVLGKNQDVNRPFGWHAFEVTLPVGLAGGVTLEIPLETLPVGSTIINGRTVNELDVVGVTSSWQFNVSKGGTNAAVEPVAGLATVDWVVSVWDATRTGLMNRAIRDNESLDVNDLGAKTSLTLVLGAGTVTVAGKLHICYEVGRASIP